MGFFDSIKNTFGGKSEAEADVTVSPSQMLREAGIDTSGLKFAFDTGSITVSGEIAEESERQKILDVLSKAPGIDTVNDAMTLAPPPAAAEPAAAAEEETAAADETQARAEAGAEGRSYTVQSGDTLWKISEQMYGNGSKYQNIFEANTDILDDPDRIFPGQTLKIPDLED
jgi:nucleoid-associated protein YgaU